MTGRYCFHRCLSVNISVGGVPDPALDGGWGPDPALDGGGVPDPALDRGGFPIQPWMGGVPQPWMGGTPSLGGTQPWMGGTHLHGGVPQPWMGGLPHLMGGVPHLWVPSRNSKHLLWLCGGQCASCIHAGGLSCVVSHLPFIWLTKSSLS